MCVCVAEQACVCVQNGRLSGDLMGTLMEVQVLMLQRACCKSGQGQAYVLTQTLVSPM